MANANGTGALSHLVVLDLATASAQSVGKVLAGLGATVVKIEPPEGDASRSMSPFAGDLAGPESSLYFAHYNTGKRSVVIDLESRGGRRQVRDLAARSDVLIESFEPGYLENIGLGYKRLARLNPGLVMTSVTTFGHTGPYHGYRGSELVAQAMGGLMYIQGDDQREPCMAPCDQAFQLASFHALYGTLAALHRRRGTGRGGHVDVSAQEATASVMFTLARYAALGEIPRRTGAMPPTAPSNYYQCADGYLCLSVVTDGHWKTFVEWTGDERLASSDFAKRHQRVKRVEEIDRIAADFVRPFTVEEFVEEGQRRHLCVSALNTVGSLTRSPHPKSRGFFAEVDHPRLGQHRYSGSPFRLSDTPSITRAAPALGQHAGWESPVLDRPSSPGPASPGRSQKEAPLAGVRIADFTRVWAGPMATRYLGDLGAEVIKIESGRFLDFGRDGGPASHIFCELNRSKLGITLNFQDERGRRLAEELVSVSDVVVDNFAAGVLERRGLGYETLKKIRPDVIVVNMPGYGISGPFSGYISYGQNLMAYSGMSHLWGHPGSGYETHSKLHYPDFVGAAAAAAGIMAALEHRTQTGRGQYVEVDQSEALLSTMGVAYLDYFANLREPEPTGNRSHAAAPHGCYPCIGDDQWCVVECWDEDQWQGLCEAIDMPELADDSRFVDLQSRLANQDALDDLIGEWTRTRTPLQVMRTLQQSGVPAGAVQSGEQLYHDYRLHDRGFIVEESRWDAFGYTASPVHMSDAHHAPERRLPNLGEHNDYVYSQILGESPEHVTQLVDEGVIA